MADQSNPAWKESEYTDIATQLFLARGSKHKKKSARGGKRPVEKAEVHIVDPTAHSAGDTAQATLAPSTQPAAKRPSKWARAFESESTEGATLNVTSPSCRLSHTSAPSTELSPKEWGRLSTPTDASSFAVAMKSSDLVDKLYRGMQRHLGMVGSLLHWMDHTRTTIKGRLHVIEEKCADYEAKNVELEKSIADEAARASEYEDQATALARGISKLDASQKVEKEARQAEVEAHGRTKAEVSKLVADERQKAVAEYKKSDAHVEQITGLFRDGYLFCLNRVGKSFPELDLSQLQPPPPAEDEDELDEEPKQTDADASPTVPACDSANNVAVTGATTEL